MPGRAVARAFLRIDRDEIVEVFGGVDHNRDVAALTGQTGATAASQNGRAKAVRERNRGDDILESFRNYHPDGDLAIV